MSKKLLIISFVVLLVLAVALFAYYFLINGNSNGTNGVSGFKSFLPFGGDSNTDQNTDNTNNVDNNTNNNQNNDTQGIDTTKKLVKISTEPVSGFGIQDTKAGTIIRYTEKATGHVYEIEMFSPRKDRVSNITIPFVYESIWGSNNSYVALINLDETGAIQNLYSFNTNTTSSSSSSTLPIQIDTNVSGVVAQGNSIFYLKKYSNGAEGRLTTFDNKNNKVVFKSAFSEYNTQYVNDKIIALNSKPYNNIPGFLYYLDPSTGKTKRVLGDISGLTTLPDPTGNKIVYLGLSNNLNFAVKNLITKTDTPLNPVSFPEKCVWGKVNKDLLYCAVPKGNIDANSLIKWYQGYDQYSDNIWIYDTKNNSVFMIEDLESTSAEKIDVIRPTMSETDHYIFFINKQNGSLWSLDLSGYATSTEGLVD